MWAALPRYYRFEGYREFEAFDWQLTQQLAAGQVLAAVPVAGAEPAQASAYYRLAATVQVWALSEPDNAWRGYFLPLEEALAHETALRGAD